MVHTDLYSRYLGDIEFDDHTLRVRHDVSGHILQSANQTVYIPTLVYVLVQRRGYWP